MIIQRLWEYYQAHKKDKDLDGQHLFPEYGYSEQRVPYCLVLTKSGKFDSFQNMDRRIFLPDMGAIDKSRTSGIASSYYAAPEKYVLGSSMQEKKLHLYTDFERLDAFIKMHEEVLSKTKDKTLKVLLTFLYRVRNKGLTKEEIAEIREAMEVRGKGFGGVIVVKVGDEYLHDQKSLISYWNDTVSNYDGVKGACLVTGKNRILRKLHGKIKGISETAVAGGSLVSFNMDAHKSFVRKDAPIVPISAEVEFGYRTVLNYFLSKKHHHTIIGKDSYVFWASSKKSTIFEKCMKFIFGSKEEKEDIEPKLQAALQAIRNGIVPENIPPEDTFCVALLSGNKGRIYVRDFIEHSIKDIVEAVKTYENDTGLVIWGEKKTFSLTSLAWAPVTGNGKEVPNKTITGALLRSLLKGEQYPISAVLRVFILCGNSEGYKMNRIALLKGYLNRKYRSENKKEIPMSLDTTRTNIGYLLGRALAVADIIQEKSIGRRPNKVLSDRFIGSLRVNPRSVLSSLIDKVQVHISQIKKRGGGMGYYFDEIFSKIIDLIDVNNIPTFMSLEDQMEFSVGFKQQGIFKYPKKEKEGDAADAADNE